MINLLRGDFTLLGPRPKHPEGVEQNHTSVFPSITTWAQVVKLLHTPITLPQKTDPEAGSRYSAYRNLLSEMWDFVRFVLRSKR